MAMSFSWGAPVIAPGKINLFLHIVGRRPDGYHLLQSVFVLINLADELRFSQRTDADIVLSHPIIGVPQEKDLVWRAAYLLKNVAIEQKIPCCGVDIFVSKRLPMGGGLGGGSSDAAATLLALNRLWQLNYSAEKLAQIGLQLGADVPFFLLAKPGKNAAFVEGIGEKVTPIAIETGFLALFKPRCSVATATAFSAPELTRNTKPVTISDFAGQSSGVAHTLTMNVFSAMRNDLQPVVASRFTEVQSALAWIGSRESTKSPFSEPEWSRMSGSGACVFAVCRNEFEATSLIEQAVKSENSTHWFEKAWAVQVLSEHPMSDWML
jgi:4-diphosphocytidyl-2-C-methyl-D-erythritol kinase